MKQTAGIHHITAIVGHPQENADFYTNVLGLRLVKKTINFDDPGTYHLYFGNDAGDPGTVMTFFPWANGRSGKIADGQVGRTTFSVPSHALPFWENHLTEQGVAFHKEQHFKETYLTFEDPHGLQLALVEREDGARNKGSHFSEDTAIKGFAGAVLYSSHPDSTSHTLEHVLSFERVGQENDLIRFTSSSDIGNTIDIKISPFGTIGEEGVGMVHHIAFRAENAADQLEWQEHVKKHGFAVTEVRDRNYFKAIYFREAGHILFEIATDDPGFTIDEPLEKLGNTLKLPAKYEKHREKLENILIPIEMESNKG